MNHGPLNVKTFFQNPASHLNWTKSFLNLIGYSHENCSHQSWTTTKFLEFLNPHLLQLVRKGNSVQTLTCHRKVVTSTIGQVFEIWSTWTKLQHSLSSTLRKYQLKKITISGLLFNKIKLFLQILLFRRSDIQKGLKFWFYFFKELLFRVKKVS